VVLVLLVLEAGFFGGLEVPRISTRVFLYLLPYEIVLFGKHLMHMSWMAVSKLGQYSN
jgi:hypothetical protein